MEQPAEETPPAEDPADPESKVEDGLGVDGGTERAIVELTDPAETAPVATQAAAESVDVVLQPQSQPFMVVEGTAEELAKLAEDPRVSSIHRDRTYTPAEVAPSLSLIGADKVHAAGTTGTGQVVAVIDTGIDVDHPWFQGRIVAQACFSATEDSGVVSLCPNGLNQQTDGNAADATTPNCLLDGVNLCDHGSHVAGIAAGTGGVAPGAGIVAVQVFSRLNDEDSCGEPACLVAYESSLRQALDYVAGLNQPLAAVNMSLGGMLYETSCDATEEGAIFKEKFDALLARNIATVVAAGNEYFEGTAHPACVSTAVTVGANDNADAIAEWSNRGSLLDLFAPGVDVESAVPDNTTTVYSGTSMATPQVTGALALMRAAAPDKPMAELIETLKTTGRPYVYDVAGAQVTTPRLDLAAALTGAAVQPPVTQSPSPVADGPADDSAPEPDPSDSSGPTPSPATRRSRAVAVLHPGPAADGDGHGDRDGDGQGACRGLHAGHRRAEADDREVGGGAAPRQRHDLGRDADLLPEADRQVEQGVPRADEGLVAGQGVPRAEEPQDPQGQAGQRPADGLAELGERHERHDGAGRGREGQAQQQAHRGGVEEGHQQHPQNR
ncbi:S8 family serine peptidase [Nonomuraea thailandensis]